MAYYGIKIKPKNKGLLHKKLGIKPGNKIPADELEVKSTDSENTKKEKVFAKNARKFSHK